MRVCMYVSTSGLCSLRSRMRECVYVHVLVHVFVRANACVCV